MRQWRSVEDEIILKENLIKSAKKNITIKNFIAMPYIIKIIFWIIIIKFLWDFLPILQKFLERGL